MVHINDSITSADVIREDKPSFIFEGGKKKNWSHRRKGPSAYRWDDNQQGRKRTSVVPSALQHCWWQKVAAAAAQDLSMLCVLIRCIRNRTIWAISDQHLRPRKALRLVAAAAAAPKRKTRRPNLHIFFPTRPNNSSDGSTADGSAKRVFSFFPLLISTNWSVTCFDMVVCSQLGHFRLAKLLLCVEQHTVQLCSKWVTTTSKWAFSIALEGKQNYW